MRTVVVGVVSVLVGVVLSAHAGDEGKGAARVKEGIDAFLAFLKKEYPHKKFKTGPAHLDSAALRTAYPNQRFYYVFTLVPLGPGANLKHLLEAHAREVENIRKNYLSLTVRIDDQGNVTPLLTPKDYNTGLMKIAGDEDARTTAAAILSLRSADHNEPVAINPKEVTIARMAGGWICHVNHRADPKFVTRSDFIGKVTFDAAGKCTGITKTYAGPLPR